MRVLFVILIIALTACSSQREVAESLEENTMQSEAKKAIVNPAFEAVTDPFQIESAEVIGQELHVKVSYSGGCKGHVFELFTDGYLMKSLPPKQNFFLRHYANKDECESLVEESLVFDLSETASHGNSLVLLLRQFDGDLRMDF